MRSRLPSWIRTGIVLAVIAGTQSGCKSGWKMPGADMFSWTRKPSETTLSGTGPSVAMPSSTTASNSTGSGVPTSPATRSSPSTINSTAANPPTATRPFGQPAGPYGQAGAGPYGQMNPNTAMANQALPAAGTAATANGYTTGNYATNQAPATQLASANPYGAPAAYPQSAPYGNPPAAMARTTMPPSPAATAGFPPGGGPSGATASIPTTPYGFAPPAGPSFAQGALPPNAGYVPLGSAPVAAVPAGFGGGSLPPSLPPQTSMPVAYGGGVPAGMPSVVAPNQASTATYRPGSVARQTSYDFSNPGPGVVPPAQGVAYPRTAGEVPPNVNR